MDHRFAHPSSAPSPTRGEGGAVALLQRARDLLESVALDDLALPHVLVLLEGHAAFLSGRDLAHLVLEALEGRELAFVDDDVVADQAHACAALDLALRHAAASHTADLRD